jgi:hypothetical protein
MVEVFLIMAVNKEIITIIARTMYNMSTTDLVNISWCRLFRCSDENQTPQREAPVGPNQEQEGSQEGQEAARDPLREKVSGVIQA